MIIIIFNSEIHCIQFDGFNLTHYWSMSYFSWLAKPKLLLCLKELTFIKQVSSSRQKKSKQKLEI